MKARCRCFEYYRGFGKYKWWIWIVEAIGTATTFLKLFPSTWARIFTWTAASRASLRSKSNQCWSPMPCSLGLWWFRIFDIDKTETLFHGMESFKNYKGKIWAIFEPLKYPVPTALSERISLLLCWKIYSWFTFPFNLPRYAARFCKILQFSARFCKILQDSARLCKIQHNSTRICSNL